MSGMGKRKKSGAAFRKAKKAKLDEDCKLSPFMLSYLKPDSNLSFQTIKLKTVPFVPTQ